MRALLREIMRWEDETLARRHFRAPNGRIYGLTSGSVPSV
jgi:hypothetical protein